jgi:hypothetical protein
MAAPIRIRRVCWNIHSKSDDLQFARVGNSLVGYDIYDGSVVLRLTDPTKLSEVDTTTRGFPYFLADFQTKEVTFIHFELLSS